MEKATFLGATEEAVEGAKAAMVEVGVAVSMGMVVARALAWTGAEKDSAMKVV